MNRKNNYTDYMLFKNLTADDSNNFTSKQPKKYSAPPLVRLEVFIVTSISLIIFFIIISLS